MKKRTKFVATVRGHVQGLVGVGTINSTKLVEFIGKRVNVIVVEDGVKERKLK